MDARDLVFPMTAGDLVRSACVLAARKRGDGVEMHLLEVLDVSEATGSDGDDLFLVLRDQVTLERSDLTLRRDTPLLVTRISRR